MNGLITIIVIAFIWWWISNNKTRHRDITKIKERKTVETPNGSITIEREREIDARTMEISREGINKFANRKKNPIDYSLIIDSNADSCATTSRPNPQQKRIDRPAKQVSRGRVTTSHPASYPLMRKEKTEEDAMKSLTPTFLELAAKMGYIKTEEPAEHPSASTEKQCPNCQRTLPNTAFRNSGKNPDGLTKWCNDCLDSSKDRKGPYKMCPQCGKRRLKSSFDKNSTRPDGLTKWCRYCMAGIKR